MRPRRAPAGACLRRAAHASPVRATKNPPGSRRAGLERELAARGHTVAIADINSGLQGIVFNGTRDDGRPGAFARAPGKGQWAGGADPRREGTAKGSAK